MLLGLGQTLMIITTKLMEDNGWLYSLIIGIIAISGILYMAYNAGLL
mgnify:CR=1 FL=1